MGGTAELKKRRFILSVTLAVLIAFTQPLSVLAADGGQQQGGLQSIVLTGIWNFTTGDPVAGPWQPIEIANGHLDVSLLPARTTAWYQRTFEVPADFAKGDLVLLAGKIDDADQVFINGQEIGRTGLDAQGNYLGTSHWEETREYAIPSNVLKYGETNTITIRVYNADGGGGIYEGAIGIYTIPALRQVKGLPHQPASDAEKNQVLAVVAKQVQAIENLDATEYENTLSPDFFHDGYTVTRAVYELIQWSNTYVSMEVVDERPYVFREGDRLIYAAHRTIYGIDASNNRTVVRAGDEDRYYRIESGAIKEIGNHSRFYVDRYNSALFNREMTFRIYLPEDYLTSGRNYPTVYLLHQYNSSSQQFEVDQLHKKLDDWIRAGIIQDMIVVMPDTSGTSWFVNRPNMPWEDLITNELIPTVDSRYRTIDDPDYRAISGVSMGGFGAYVIGLKHPELFRSVASHMGALGYSIAGQNPFDLIKQLGKSGLAQYSLYLDGGTEDALTNMAGSTNDIREYLRQNGINHQYYTGPGEHNSEFYMQTIRQSFVMHHNHFANGLLTGSISANPQAITLTDAKTTVTYTIQVDPVSVAKYVYSPSASAPLKVELVVKQAETGQTVLTEQAIVADLAQTASTIFSGTFDVDKNDLNAGDNFTVQVQAKWLGMTFTLGSASLIKVQPVGVAPEDIQIDLMGNWKFIKEDPSSPIDGADPHLDDSGWRMVQPGLGWWEDGFGGYPDMGSYIGGAWYRRTFTVPGNFPTEGLTLLAGKIDDADEVYINGHLVGATGMKDGKFVESFWAVTREYPLDASVLNYGGENVIAIRMYNNNGGGGFYAGPVGIYTKESLRKAKGLPYERPNASIRDAVLAAVAKQSEALAAKDFDMFGATISESYFERGKQKPAFVAEWKALLEAYDGIQVTVSDPEVYRSNGNTLVVANWEITGKTADGHAAVILSGKREQFFAEENGAWFEVGDQNRIFAASYYSEAIGREMTYRIFLPPSYATSDKRYPVVYLLHQFQSDSSSFVLDNVHGLLDRSMAADELDEMIVVMPDSDGMSWWINRNGGPAWEDMVVKDLVPWIDSQYRTIKSADFRGITGVSMGGFGSFAIGFGNPDVFTSVASHMGAVGFTIDGTNPTEVLKSLDKDTLARYSIYLDSGDKDGYRFDLSALAVHRYLLSQQIPHYFEIRDGAHDSVFYTASILKSFGHHAVHFARSARATAISLDASSYSMRAGETRKLTVTGMNEGRLSDLTPLADFATSNAAVVTVNEDGVMTAKAAGTATVTATYQGLTATATVTVRSSGGGGTTSGGSAAPVSQEPSVDESGTVVLDLSGAIREGTAVAVADVDEASIASALKQAVAGADGRQRIRLNIGEVERAQGYAVQLPANVVAADANYWLEIATPLGIVTIAADMFGSVDVQNRSTAVIAISAVSADEWDASVRAVIGSRPVVEITASLDGEMIHWSNPDAPAMVAIPYRPGADEEQNAHQLIVLSLDESGRAAPVINSGYDAGGCMTFTTDRFGRFAIAFVKHSFADLAGHWARKPVEWLAARGIVSGMSATAFAPDRNVTRADFALLLVKAFELVSDEEAGFADVAKDAYYYDAVRIAKALGIVAGLGDNRFGPGESLTRQDMLVMVDKALAAAGKPLARGSDQTLAKFADADQVSGYALESVKALVNAGIIVGYDNRLNPAGTATRAEIAVILEKLLKNLK